MQGSLLIVFLLSNTLFLLDKLNVTNSEYFLSSWEHLAKTHIRVSNIMNEVLIKCSFLIWVQTFLLKLWCPHLCQ